MTLCEFLFERVSLYSSSSDWGFAWTCLCEFLFERVSLYSSLSDWGFAWTCLFLKGFLWQSLSLLGLM